MNQQQIDNILHTKKVIKNNMTFFGRFMNTFHRDFDYKKKDEVEAALTEAGVDDELRSSLKVLNEVYDGSLVKLLEKLSGGPGKPYYLNNLSLEERIINAFFRIEQVKGKPERDSRGGEGGIFVPYNWMRARLADPKTYLAVFAGSVVAASSILAPDVVPFSTQYTGQEGLANFTPREAIHVSYEGIQDFIPLLPDTLNTRAIQTYIIVAEASIVTTSLYFVSSVMGKLSEGFNRLRGKEPTSEKRSDSRDIKRGVNTYISAEVLNVASQYDKPLIKLKEGEYFN